MKAPKCYLTVGSERTYSARVQPSLELALQLPGLVEAHAPAWAHLQCTIKSTGEADTGKE